MLRTKFGLLLMFMGVFGLAGISVLAGGWRAPAVTIRAGEMGASEGAPLVCAGKIEAHLVFPRQWDGHHTLEGLWVKPDGDTQERAVIELDLGPSNRSAYFWMQFKEPSLFDEIKLGGYGENEFNGRWTFVALVQGEAVATVHFDVQCP